MKLVTVRETFRKKQRRLVQTGGRGQFGVIEWEIGPRAEAEGVEIVLPPEDSDEWPWMANVIPAVIEERKLLLAETCRPCSVRAAVIGVQYHSIDSTVRVMGRLAAEMIRELCAGEAVPVEPLAPWGTPDVLALARGIDANRDHDALRVLADALEEAGCERADVLRHLRECRDHEGGCWVPDAILRPEG